MAKIRYVNCNLAILDEEHTEYRDTFRRTPVKGFLRRDQDGDALVEDTITRLHAWIASDKQSPYIERDDLELLGRHLYYFLFDESIRTAFEECYQGFRDGSFDENARLRLVLAFHEKAKRLAALPWEFLFMPKRENQPGFFVCAEKRTELILTRFVPESSPDDTLHPEETNLKILVVFANPSELGRRLNADEFLEKIAAMKRVEVKSITKEAATRQDVERVIGEFKPHVFHFIGHGDAEKGIALMRTPEEIEEYLNETGDIKDVEWVDGRGLNSMFANAHPRLVFLHACNGATADSMNGFNSTAHDLVYSYRVPAVIAMQYAIENGAAARFARTFYQQISDGSSIDIAVSEGRWELRQSQRGEFADPAFGTPIVYVQNERAESAIIDHRAEEAETPRVVSCPYGCGGFVVVGTPFCGTCKQPLTGEAGVAQATASSSTRDSQVETGHGGVAPELADTQEPTSSGLSATVDGVKELTRIE